MDWLVAVFQWFIDREYLTLYGLLKRFLALAAPIISLIGIVRLVQGWVSAIRTRRKRRAEQERRTPGRTERFPYEPLEPTDVFRHLRGIAGPRPEHVSRPEVTEATAREPDGLLLWGPQGCGKTREAAEYALHRAGGLLGAVKCFVIDGKDPLDVPLGPPGFDLDAAVVIFDDLHEHWLRHRAETEIGHALGLHPGQRACEIVEYFTRETHGVCVAIATVRDEWWSSIERDDAMRPAVERLTPSVRLGLLRGEQTERDFLAAACEAHGFTLSEQALDRLAEANDGTLLAAHEYLTELSQRAPGPRDLTLEEAAGLEQACRQSWRQRVLPSLPPHQQEAVELAGVLFACGVPIRREFLRALARERGSSNPDRALDELAKGPFPEDEGEFRPHASRLQERRAEPVQEAVQVARALLRLAGGREIPREIPRALAGLEARLWALGSVTVLTDLNEGRRALAAGPRERRRTCGRLARSLAVPDREPSREKQPEQWAQAWSRLGASYLELPSGDRSTNLLRAIQCFGRALQVFTREAAPDRWAVIHNNLGIAWGALPTGDRQANLSQAIEHLQAATEVLTRESDPVRWAGIRNNLGNVAARLGDDENLRAAIAHFEAAAEVYTEQDHPYDHAMVHNNLGNAWLDLTSGDRHENMLRAVENQQRALEIWDRRREPEEWAGTQHNLGNAWAELGETTGPDDLRRAIACYQAALQVRTETALPLVWAETRLELAAALVGLAAHDDPEANLAAARDHLQAALTVLTEEAAPEAHQEARALLAKVDERLGQAP